MMKIYSIPFSFFGQMHVLEYGKAQCDLQSQHFVDDISSPSELPTSSTRKSVKQSRESSLLDFIKRLGAGNEILIQELCRGNEELEKTRQILERLVEKV